MNLVANNSRASRVSCLRTLGMRLRSLGDPYTTVTTQTPPDKEIRILSGSLGRWPSTIVSSEGVMSAREFLLNVSVILAVMALASALETVVPMFVERSGTQGRRTANFGLTVLVFLVNWLLTSAAAIAGMAWSAKPTAPIAPVPGFAQVAAAVVPIDFCTRCLAHPIRSLPGFLQVALGVVLIDFCT